MFDTVGSVADPVVGCWVSSEHELWWPELLDLTDRTAYHIAPLTMTSANLSPGFTVELLFSVGYLNNEVFLSHRFY